MSEFTRKTWQLDGIGGNGPLLIYATDLVHARSEEPKGRYRFAAKISSPYSGNTPRRELEANARLMVAAPKLLAALEAILDAGKIAGVFGPYDEAGKIPAALYREGRDIIAQATETV